MNDNQRIAKNTFYLYIRMGMTLFVQFYTLRVVLKILGVNDFGLWSVVTSFIVSFSFVSGPLTAATQRFLSFEMGLNGKRMNEIFNASLLLFMLIGVVLFLLLETVGVWFLNTQMSIVNDKISIANWVFQFSIFSFIMSLIRMPYESAIIAIERMSFYAVLCIIESVLSLLMVYLLLLSMDMDKLILYGILTFISKFVVTLCYKLYCAKNILYTRFRLVWDTRLMMQIAEFSGWNLFGAMASTSSNQGVNVMINMFFGVVVNASYGIASQIGSGIKSFVDNFQKAANPQIIKRYAVGEMESLHNLICTVSKYSFFLFFTLACPVMLNMEFVLELWLGDIPFYTMSFCNLILVQMLIVSLASSMDTAVFATGKIRNYQIVLSVLIFLNVFFSYASFKMGFNPISTFVVKCIIEIFILIARLIFLKKMINLSLKRYVRKTLVPVVIIMCVTLGLMLGILNCMPEMTGWKRLWVTCTLFVFVYIFNIWFVGIGGQERILIKKWINNKIKK